MLVLDNGKIWEDTSKEEAFAGVALYLTRLCFPPLPLVCADGRICNSHDLLASIYINVPDKRHVGEAELHERFLKLDASCDFFQECCRYTSELVALATGSKMVGSRFQGASDVCRGDATHVAMAHYCAAQDLILESPTPLTFEQYQLKDYADLLQLHKQRVFHLP